MADSINLIPDGYRTDGSDKQAVHGVMCVGRVQFLFKHDYLKALETANPSKYSGIGSGVYLTGFKLEEILLSADGMLDNAKLIPMLNGDTMTLTNSNKSGIMSIPATRTAAGIVGGDIVAIGDFIRSQGDSVGGTLEVSWSLNGEDKKITFQSVCFRKVPPLRLAGNDLPSLNVEMTYASYSDSDYPTWE